MSREGRSGDWPDCARNVFDLAKIRSVGPLDGQNYSIRPGNGHTAARGQGFANLLPRTVGDKQRVAVFDGFDFVRLLLWNERQKRSSPAHTLATGRSNGRGRSVVFAGPDHAGVRAGINPRVEDQRRFGWKLAQPLLKNFTGFWVHGEKDVVPFFVIAGSGGNSGNLRQKTLLHGLDGGNRIPPQV